MQRLALMLLAASSLGMTCGPLEPPEPDACGDPGAGVVSSLEIGPETSGELPFVAWAAADTAYISSGAQGGYMVGVTLRIDGGALPSCLGQTTRLSFRDQVVELDVPVHTYEDAASEARVTRTLWLVLDQVPGQGEVIEVTTQAGGLTASTALTIVANRHELVSLTQLTPTPRSGDLIELELEVLRRPAFDALEVWTSTPDWDVLGVEASHRVYDDVSIVRVEALDPGTGELRLGYGDQELRATVTVAPR